MKAKVTNEVVKRADEYTLREMIDSLRDLGATTKKFKHKTAVARAIGALMMCYSLPAEHGAIKDVDAIYKTIEENCYTLKGVSNSTDKGMFLVGIKQAIDEAPTIFEANKKKESE